MEYRLKNVINFWSRVFQLLFVIMHGTIRSFIQVVVQHATLGLLTQSHSCKASRILEILDKIWKRT